MFSVSLFFNGSAFLISVTSTPTKPPKKGRGRPRGSGVGRRPRGRGSAKKTMTAAEIAGAQAGMTAAYAAYGYNFTGIGKMERLCQEWGS